MASPSASKVVAAVLYLNAFAIEPRLVGEPIPHGILDCAGLRRAVAPSGQPAIGFGPAKAGKSDATPLSHGPLRRACRGSPPAKKRCRVRLATALQNAGAPGVNPNGILH